jgi:hypothetical protein
MVAGRPRRFVRLHRPLDRSAVRTTYAAADFFCTTNNIDLLLRIFVYFGKTRGRSAVKLALGDLRQVRSL